MACKSPLFRVDPRYSEDLPPHLSKQTKNNNGLIVSKDYLPILLNYLNLSNLQEIPCGHCVQCYLKRSRDWALRIMLESSYHKHNYFITLTYDADHLSCVDPPFKGCVDFEGNFFESELKIKDFQDFMKRFRKRVKDDFDIDGMRIAYCGEYGEEGTKRPHFHLILMGAPDLSDYLVFHRYDYVLGVRVNYYKCSYILNEWQNGLVEVTDLCFGNAAYVAGYVFKKQYKVDYSVPDVPEGYKLRVQPFFQVSRRPGIGRHYFDENFREFYKNDEIFIKHNKRVLQLKPPRYYDKLFDIIDPIAAEEVKLDRARDFKKNTSDNKIDYLRKAGERVERRIRSRKSRGSGL